MIGQTVSHYRILEKLGQGGMGEVYLADDTSLGRKVALKFLPLEMQQDISAHRRFIREAHSAAALDHPYICSIHEVGESEGKDFIVMEYVDGLTLRDRLAKGPLASREALQIAFEIAEALEEAHEKGVVHRDLKPGNIMLTRKGHAKVMDFGLAKQLIPSGGMESQEETVTRLTQAATTLGTLAYMSPEQLRGEPVDVRSDIFSFGVVLYEMLAGVHPFKRQSGMDTASAILTAAPQALAGLRPETPPQLQQIVDKMLAKDARDRYTTIHAVRADLGRLLQTGEETAEGKAGWRKVRYWVIAVALLAVVAGGLWYRHYSKVRWAKLEAIPEIERIQQNGRPDSRWWLEGETKFRLALEAERYLPNDPVLARLMSGCVRTLTIETNPPGAKVYVRHYVETDGTWSLLGTTPLKEVRVPYAVYRWRFEKDGYEVTEAALTTWPGKVIQRTLDKVGTRPAGMVPIMGDKVEDVGKVGDFYIDRCEVNNKQYKEFVSLGGYQKPEYWKHRFVKDGKELSWEQAMAEFRDSTGRPGPSTWEAGDFPPGHGEYPVSGVSWFEAAAFAEFAHKSLPTIHHWGLAAGEALDFNIYGFPALFYQMSNFGKPGPVEVGSSRAMNDYGALDMGGNVREWCWNESEDGRYVRGGAWDDASYMYGNWSQQSPWNRSPKNGLRCVIYPHPDAIPSKAFEPVPFKTGRDFRLEKPVADDIFRVYKAQFGYDRTDLQAKVEARDETAQDWIVEKISFGAAYPGDRVLAYLFLPKTKKAPLQTVIYYPGSLAVTVATPEERLSEFTGLCAFFVRTGRAVLFPVYYGTYERKGEMDSARHWPRKEFSHAYTEYLIKWGKDLRRSIDYLETRQDIDPKKVAYYGFSWGGVIGTIIPAVEERLKVVILTLGGFLDSEALPEACGLNYVSRISVPTLMLNGRYDMVFPFDLRVKPAFDLLGTPSDSKRLLVYDTDHGIPQKELIRECLGWLDRYLGPVQ